MSSHTTRKHTKGSRLSHLVAEKAGLWASLTGWVLQRMLLLPKKAFLQRLLTLNWGWTALLAVLTLTAHTCVSPKPKTSALFYHSFVSRFGFGYVFPFVNTLSYLFIFYFSIKKKCSLLCKARVVCILGLASWSPSPHMTANHHVQTKVVKTTKPFYSKY